MPGLAPETLPWLLPPPEDIRPRIRAFGRDAPGTAAELRGLAGFALDLDQLTALDKAVARAEARPEGALDPAGLAPVRFAILGDGTLDHLAPAVRASGPRHGVLPAVHLPPYGAALAELSTPGSALHVFRPDVALLAPDCRMLGLAVPRMDAAEADAAVAAAFAGIRAQADAASRLGATLILQTLAPPPDPWTGHFDARASGAPATMVRALNDRLVAFAAETNAVLLDAAALAAAVGGARWFDAGEWHRSKLPFAWEFAPLWADHVARLLGAMRGKARKCLALDLDNTLWGGVIGDDGVEGIRLGQGSPTGEAHLAVQRFALDLKARGVVLAVVSKNEDAAARLPFRHHPDMLMKEADIAVFLANWNDKATNLAHVARTLNIGIDALAFLDDNPAERERVRQMLPEVAVPEVGDDPALYPVLLAQSGLFETVGLSADDRARAEQYRQNAERAVAMEQIGNYEDYLASLDMHCDIRPFDAVGRTRIAQLINKSNQFNLTTRRYTEAEVAAIEADPDLFDLQVRLTDRFGDNGMISVVVFRKGADDWLCDTWLMSCRVLGRRVEEAILARVAAAARAAGASRLLGDYLPSPKNRMVEDHFPKLGFLPLEHLPGDGRRFVLDLATYEEPHLPMRLTGLLEPT